MSGVETRGQKGAEHKGYGRNETTALIQTDVSYQEVHKDAAEEHVQDMAIAKG